MGLDMYLMRRDNDDVDNAEDIQLGYWRKANAIHRWFVKNLANGVDDCKPIPVTVDDLKKLLELCKEVLKDNKRGPKLLPTQEGFFFGSIFYDHGYIDDIIKTVEIIESILKYQDLSELELYYQASW
jgi:hypothetical protein